jgi:hypothetical protein
LFAVSVGVIVSLCVEDASVVVANVDVARFDLADDDGGGWESECLASMVMAAAVEERRRCGEERER